MYLYIAILASARGAINPERYRCNRLFLLLVRVSSPSQALLTRLYDSLRVSAFRARGHSSLSSPYFSVPRAFAFPSGLRTRLGSQELPFELTQRGVTSRTIVLLGTLQQAQWIGEGCGLGSYAYRRQIANDYDRIYR